MHSDRGMSNIYYSVTKLAMTSGHAMLINQHLNRLMTIQFSLLILKTQIIKVEVKSVLRIGSAHNNVRTL